MIKDLQQSNISLSDGIHRTPTIGEAGELSECVNLIPKAGELVTIPLPEYSNIELEGSERLIAIHDTTEVRNFIVCTGEGSDIHYAPSWWPFKKKSLFISVAVLNHADYFECLVSFEGNIEESDLKYKPVFSLNDGQTFTPYNEATFDRSLIFSTDSTNADYDATLESLGYGIQNPIVGIAIEGIDEIESKYGISVPITTDIRYDELPEDSEELPTTDLTGTINLLYFSDVDGQRRTLLTDILYGIATIGNTLVVSTRSGIRYFVYTSGEGYTEINNSTFRYTAGIQELRAGNRSGINSVCFESETIAVEDVLGSAHFNDRYFSKGLTKSQMMNLWSEVDSAMEVIIGDDSEELHEDTKYITPVILAVELYDGSYISVSNVAFVNWADYSDELYLDVLHSGRSAQKLVVGTKTEGFVSSPEITISSDFSEIKDIVRGIAVFTAPGVNPYKTQEEGSAVLMAADSDGRGGRTGIQNIEDVEKVGGKYPWDYLDVRSGRQLPTAWWRIKYEKKETDELLRDIGDSVFYKTDFVKVEELVKAGGTITRELKRCTGTEEHITLTDFGVMSYESNILFAYNGRLNLANYRQNISGERLSYIGVKDASSYYEGHEPRIHYSKTEAVFVVKAYTRARGEEYVYYTENIPYSLQSLLTIPIQNVQSATIYIKETCVNGNSKTTRWYMKELTGFLTADGGQYSIALFDYGSMAPRTESEGGDWSGTARDGYEYYYTKSLGKPSASKPNQVIYSSSSNPFVFGHTVQVGSGSILGLSTTAQALSQGQFGQFPLYVFCSDGIWALEVGNDGTYSVRQPISRDVCTNPAAITQLDGSVAFVTKQGLKMISGSNVSLLSANVEGLNVGEDFFVSELEDWWDKIRPEGSITTPVVTDTSQFVEQLQGAQIAYDYANSLLHIFPLNNDDDSGEEIIEKHYAYSLENGEWSTQILPMKILTSVPCYPLSVIQFGRKLYSYTKETTDDMQIGYALTRSNAMGNPVSRKMLADLRLIGQQTQTDSNRAVAIYVSNDNRSWFPLTSLKKMSAKYYRFLVMGYMHALDTLTGIVLQYQERFTNKMR